MEKFNYLNSLLERSARDAWLDSLLQQLTIKSNWHPYQEVRLQTTDSEQAHGCINAGGCCYIVSQCQGPASIVWLSQLSPSQPQVTWSGDWIIRRFALPCSFKQDSAGVSAHYQPQGDWNWLEPWQIDGVDWRGTDSSGESWYESRPISCVRIHLSLHH